MFVNLNVLLYLLEKTRKNRFIGLEYEKYFFSCLFVVFKLIEILFEMYCCFDNFLIRKILIYVLGSK